MPAVAALVPAIKALAAGAGRQAVMGAAKQGAKQIAKDKAKDFVTGRGRKKKKRKGRGREGALTTTGEDEGSEEGGSAIVPTTPMVGSYRVETPPQKPEEVGKPSKVNYETINNQLDSIIGLTNALKKTSAAKLKTDENRRKAERKAAEKAKKRQRENMLEGAGGAALGMAGNLYGKATQGFDPLKFFTMIFFGSLLKWVTTHGSKIIALLKGTLALFNNAGKLLRAGLGFLGKTIKGAFGLLGKVASPIIKLGKGIGTALKGVGKRLGSAFGKLGNSVKNFAKGILNKLKAAGKILTAPIRALQGLTGAEKKAVQTNKGLNKLVKESGTKVSQNLGTATRPPGTISNATKSMRLKHGDEAARMYQGLVDNGMKPSKAAQYVNKSIASGKLTSAPLEGSLAGGKKGSQLFKGGLGRSTDRVITKIGGKNALKASKALKNALGRIPVVGGLITLVVSLLGGDPVTQALFKAGGAVLGGFLGSFIPIPVVGTLMGELIGEYVGDLMYVATMGGGVEAVGQKLKDDIAGVLSAGKAAMDWVGKGFGRMYEGIPKINIPFVGEFPNAVWMANPFNLMEKLGIFHKAFFTNDPMEKGEVKTEGTEESSGGSNNVTNMSSDRAYTDKQGDRAGDFVTLPDGSLRVKDGFGTRSLTPEEQSLYDSGATNIDGSKSTPVTTTPNQSSGGKYSSLLGFISKGEGGYNSMNQGTIGNNIVGSTHNASSVIGKNLTDMTIGEIMDRQAYLMDKSNPQESDYGIFAAGRYQIIPSTMKFAVSKAGLSRSDKFSPENQDKLGIALITQKQPRVDDYLSGRSNDIEGAMDALADEFASMPDPKTGNSKYGGGNRAAHTVEEVRAALLQARGESQQAQTQQSVQTAQPQTPNVQPQTPLVEGQKKTAVLSYGTNDWGLSESEIKKRATGMIRDLMSKGYNVVVVPPNKDLNVEGYGKKDAPYRGVYAAAAETGATIESGKYQTGDTLHLEPADAKRIFNKYRSAVYVGDSNAVRMKASESGDYSNTSTAVSGAGGDDIKEQIDSSVETVSTRQATPDNSDKMASQDQSDSDTSSAPAPAQVSASPQVQTQMSSGISGISQQLPYEQSGSTVVMMQGSGGQQMPMGGRGGRGTPVMMGSGDVVNSYYKSQLMGSLYKQG